MKVRDLAHKEDRDSALALAQRHFGHLDLGGATVEEELSETNWAESTGLFVDGRCEGTFLVRRSCLADFAAERMPDVDLGELSGLRGMRGDALILSDGNARHAARLIRAAVADRDVDYLWGTAHKDLDNEGFWRRHSVILGDCEDGTETAFAVAVSPKARVALENVAAALSGSLKP